MGDDRASSYDATFAEVDAFEDGAAHPNPAAIADAHPLAGDILPVFLAAPVVGYVGGPLVPIN